MQKLQLAIPEPCHQDWADMTPNQQGRFCSSCAKTVVDFSAMSDAQLILYFENLKNENVCGRVYPDQLDRSIQALPKPKKKLFLYWQYVIAFFMMLGKGQSAKAQGEMKVRTVLQPDTSKKSKRVQEDTPIMLGMIARPIAKEVTAAKEWHISDENGEAIANATLQFFPSGNAIAADENGIAVPGKNSKADSVTVSAIGYQTKTIALKDIAQYIVLASEEILLGEVVVPSIESIRCRTTIAGGIGYRVVRQTLSSDTIQNIMSVFDPALTIYPNPVSKGGTLQLAFQLNKTGLYKIDISDVSGKLLVQQSYTAHNRKAATTINIPAGWGNGTYFIILYNEKGEKKGRGKFIVQ